MDKDDAAIEHVAEPSPKTNTLKGYLSKFPLLKGLYRRVRSIGRGEKPFTSAMYWDERYKRGGTSGLGSYGQFAEFKAEILNDFVVKHDITSVIEFGCGDGNQLKLSSYPTYLGFDVSDAALSTCRLIFADDSTKSFKLIRDYNDETAELSLSLDVIYHLVEDEVYDLYMRRLFQSATRFVIIYSSNFDELSGLDVLHVRHRKFTQWVDDNMSGWSLVRHVPNRYSSNNDETRGSSANFYIYTASN